MGTENVCGHNNLTHAMDISGGTVRDSVPWSKIGINLDIGETEETMWPVGGLYAWPTEATTMTLVSDSIEDDPVKADTNAGTGAYTVTVYYLDINFAEKTVVVTLNGTSAVAVASDIYRVQNMRVSTSGTGLAAAGNLSLKSGATTYGFISAGRTRQRLCTWTVPVNKVLYITQIAFSCSNQATSKYCRFTTRANYDNLSNTVLQRGLFMPYNEVTLNNTAYWRELNPPTKLPATTDLKVCAVANSSAAGTCSLRGVLKNA